MTLDNAKRYAVPCAEGRLAQHFGHCGEFALVDVDDGQVINVDFETPPPHEPGVLPRWLAEQGAQVVIAGGMGMRAQQLFAQSDIEVVVGAESLPPEDVVKRYLDGTLSVGDNLCDH
jgi:predicted Fe-Mo cluster-binding NifX family protein